MRSLREQIQRMKDQTWDPDFPISKIYYKTPYTHVRWEFARIVETRDPEMLGQVRLHFPQWGDGAVTGWVPVLRRFFGHFALPDVGDTVMVTFVQDDPSQPVVMGGIRNENQPCPTGTNKGNYRKIMSLKSGKGYIVLDDTPGNERIEMGMDFPEGSMGWVLDKNKGLRIFNDVGDINIEGKKITIRSDDNLTIEAEKKLTLVSGDDMTIESNKNVMFKAGKKITVKGQEIKLDSSMVTAEKKAVAKKDDQVIGVDQHKEWVQAGSSKVQVPIPNPFQGKLADKLSKNVKMGSNPVATKGSKAKNQGHKVMPPGDSFVKPPKDEGTVTNGTIPSVKVNGKEIAVLGSTVTCCDDLGGKDQGKVIAQGSSEQPAIKIPETKPIDRSLQNPKWNKSEGKVGEQLSLNVQLKNQYDGANVKFKVYPEGADVNKSMPLAVLWGKNDGGKAFAGWTGIIVQGKNESQEPDHKNYFFTAESFGCAKVQSGMVKVGQKLLELKLEDKKTNKPIPSAKYKVTFEDGTVRSGKLNKNGFALEKNVPECGYEIVYKTETEEYHVKK